MFNTLFQILYDKMSFGGDPKFLARLKEQLENHTSDSTVDPEEVAQGLMQKYPDYGRKKQKPFVRMVAEAFDKLGVNEKDEEDIKVIAETTPRDHRKRKLSKSKSARTQDVVLDSDENDPDMDKYVTYPKTNRANKSITNLYASGASNAGTPLSSNSKDRPKKATINGKPVNAASLAKPRGLGAVSIEFLPKKSEISFQHLGGCNRQFLEVCRLAMHMRRPRTFSMLGVEPPKGFLVHGPPGCGKTMFAQAIAGEFNLPMFQLAATELVSGVSGETEEKLRQLFEATKRHAPCVLIIDDIDSIAPRRETASREMERRVVTQLCNCLDELFLSPKEKPLEDKINFSANGEIQIDNEPPIDDHRVLVIGTTSRADALDNGLRRAGRFDSEIALGIPDEDAREKILATICKLPLDASISYRMLARLTPGYVGADLKALITVAAKCAVSRIFDTMVHHNPKQKQMTNAEIEEELQKVLAWLVSDDDPSTITSLGGFSVTMADFERALQSVQPSAKREGFATVPDVSWEEIGALQDVRQELEWNILYPIKRPEDFALLGISSKPQGILLCGPPGCGKTLLAKAVANETGMNFISVKGPELLNMYVGESERAVRTVFSRARDSSPCVIFFDEIDALCPKRSHNESSGGSRLVNQLLTEMDGVEARKQVFLIGATNRPDIVDPAVLRPGRLDKILFVDFPSGPDRADILRKSTKNGTRPHIAQDFNMDAFACSSTLDGFTGADLSALIHEAGIIALKERLFENKNDVDSVNETHFQKALIKIRPSVSEADKKRYERMKLLYTTGGLKLQATAANS
ncbi:unnamed protein product, partial [Mesorhabditis belari]|uniref:AAA+ ATPase domain-containing protein n=1 Tax=Mesorhabditis belari TaxID=2138241 RepID=A0AAF3EWJ6_9BILA